MRFTELRLQNFLSFGAEQVIPLADRGLLAVMGQNNDSSNASSNGSGKSSLMEGIVWCLWGATLRGLTGDAVVHKDVGKDCRVQLTIEDGGVTYQIARTRCDSSAKKPNDVVVLVNGASVTAGTNADAQQQIDVIVGMDAQTFTQSVLLSHGERSFSEMTDKEQKDVLEDILQIDMISKAQQVAKRRLMERQNLLASVETQRVRLFNEIGAVENELVDLQVNAHEHAGSQQRHRLTLLREKVTLEAQQEEYAPTETLQSLVDAAQALQVASVTLEQETAASHGKVLNLQKRTFVERGRLQQGIGVVTGQLRALKGYAQSVSAVAGTVCPTCRQHVDPSFADDVLAQQDAQVLKLEQERQELDEKMVKVQEREKRELDKITEKQAAVDAARKDNNDRRFLANQKIQKRVAALENAVRLDQQVSAVVRQLAALSTEQNPYEALCLKAQAKIDALRAQQVKVRYRLRALALEVAHLQFWERGFSNQGLKSYVIDGAIPFLNERAQYYADIMSGGDIQVTFSTQKQLKSGQWREEFQVQVVNRQGADVYKGNSAGEKRRSDIAVGWALGDLAASRAKKPIRFRGLDEVFEGLDEPGEDAVFRLLHAVLPQYETILCITHQERFQSQFSNVLQITKSGGFSRVA